MSSSVMAKIKKEAEVFAKRKQAYLKNMNPPAIKLNNKRPTRPTRSTEIVKSISKPEWNVSSKPVRLVYDPDAACTRASIATDALKIFDVLHTDVNIVILAGERLPTILYPRHFDFWKCIVELGYPERSHKYRLRVKAYLQELAETNTKFANRRRHPSVSCLIGFTPFSSLFTLSF